MKDDELQERTEWHRIQAWGKLGDYAAVFQKGSQIRVEGELRGRESETDGTYEIVASSILILRPGQRDTAANADAEQSSAPIPSKGTAP